MGQEVMNKTKQEMDKVIESLNYNLSQIRTGRANPNMLDRVNVSYYGSLTPLNQVSSISVVEGRQICIKPFDKSLVSEIERAINEANLGINPQNDGENIRLNVPPLTQDLRKALTKDVSKYAEEAKVRIRNARRDANDAFKKNSDLSEDSIKGYQNDVQKLTDQYIKDIDVLAKNKEEDIMTI
ncbi:MAG: ribosome recycling factor [Bacilli bacterium]